MRSDSPSSERISPEELAAFLDGTLSAAERERVLAVMARSEDSYDALLDAAAIQRELEAATTTATASPRLQAPARWRAPRMFGAFALAAAAVLLAVWIAQRSRSEDERLLAVVASATASGAAADDVIRIYGAAWNAPGWTEARGADGPSAELRSIRAGVRFAELHAALASADTAAQQSARALLVGAIAGIDGGPLLASTIEQVGRANAPIGAAAVFGQLRALGESPVWFDLGVWMEVARLSALSGHAEFFAADGRAIAELRRIIAAADRLGAEQRQLSDPILAPLRQLTADARAPDLAASKAAVDSALAGVAR